MNTPEKALKDFIRKEDVTSIKENKEDKTMNYKLGDLIKLVNGETVLNIITKGYINYEDKHLVLDFQIKQKLGSNNLFIRVLDYDADIVIDWLDLPFRALDAEIEEIEGSTETIITDGYEHTCIDVVCSDVEILSQVFETLKYYSEKGGE